MIFGQRRKSNLKFLTLILVLTGKFFVKAKVSCFLLIFCFNFMFLVSQHNFNVHKISKVVRMYIFVSKFLICIKDPNKIFTLKPEKSIKIVF